MSYRQIRITLKLFHELADCCIQHERTQSLLTVKSLDLEQMNVQINFVVKKINNTDNYLAHLFKVVVTMTKQESNYSNGQSIYTLP